MNRLAFALSLALCTTLLAQSKPATAPATKPANKPTTTPAQALQREIAHLANINERLKSHPKLKENAYIRLELALANRFIERQKSGTGKGDTEPEWKLLQMDEVGFVLNRASEMIDDIESGKLPPEGLGPVPIPTGGPVKIDNGVFVTDTILHPGDTPKPRPYYFGGYGHFQSIVTDLPWFPKIGVSLVQDGRNGPREGLNKDRTLTQRALEVKTMLDTAAKSNVKVDILTSPHYFPEWADTEAPDMVNGTVFRNINHPHEREIIGTYLKLLAAQNKDSSSLFSYCLSNEPAYSNSGRDKESAPLWHQFLKDRHKTIASLNALYQTTFKSFDEVPADGWKDDAVGQRRAYDWICFNDQNFADWHKWQGDVLKEADPRALTHAKIMVFFTLDKDKIGWGIDPEKFCRATDIAGCDAYSQMIAGVGPLDETASKEYAYHWQVEEMCYDLLHSFGNQPVFNSENHPIENANGAYRYPSRQSRAAIWQGGLHHQGATTTWVWEEPPVDPSLLHSIYYRPGYCWGQQRALLDLNRLSAEVTAINQAKPTVAILYSPASRFWDADYGVAVRTIYTALNFMGDKVTFVSENQIASGNIPAVQAIILPHTQHVQRDAILNLIRYRKTGGRLVMVGENCATRDEYDRPFTERLGSNISLDTEQKTAEQLRLLLGSPARSAVIDIATQKPGWGIEYRIIEHDRHLLVPVMNMLKTPLTVDLNVAGGEDEAVDLLTGEIVKLKSLKLDPMIPHLFKVGWHG